ncbi:hypothetical protein NAPIS_ORF00854 [Vairimorpha apis BRL 01]|uniref:Uncharacterized protein n=1 Tax=Vairimorpha apis BRL 01 TaxID=1037528 RepID=T0MEP8_9MICR|nr:hypothetical protein NAPIS_ORF00854 [Vairimorpha apis BRL 01]
MNLKLYSDVSSKQNYNNDENESFKRTYNFNSLLSFYKDLEKNSNTTYKKSQIIHEQQTNTIESVSDNSPNVIIDSVENNEIIHEHQTNTIESVSDNSPNVIMDNVENNEIIHEQQTNTIESVSDNSPNVIMDNVKDNDDIKNVIFDIKSDFICLNGNEVEKNKEINKNTNINNIIDIKGKQELILNCIKKEMISSFNIEYSKIIDYFEKEIINKFVVKPMEENITIEYNNRIDSVVTVSCKVKNLF